MMHNAADTEARCALARAFVATWPDQYATVRDTIPLGFVPGCYYAGPEEWGGYNPPTKFHFPRAGVVHPHHANGIGEGAAILVFTHKGGDPDTMRHEPVWQCGPNHLHDLLGGYRCTRYGMTFDAAIAHAIRIGDYLHAHYLVPEVDPSTRDPRLTWDEWREVAAVPLDSDSAPAPTTQLSMFEPAPEPAPDPSWMGRARTALRAAMSGRNILDDSVISFTGSFGLYDLIDRANRLRMEAGVPPFVDEEAQAA